MDKSPLKYSGGEFEHLQFCEIFSGIWSREKLVNRLCWDSWANFCFQGREWIFYPNVLSLKNPGTEGLVKNPCGLMLILLALNFFSLNLKVKFCLSTLAGLVDKLLLLASYRKSVIINLCVLWTTFFSAYSSVTCLFTIIHFLIRWLNKIGK